MKLALGVTLLALACAFANETAPVEKATPALVPVCDMEAKMACYRDRTSEDKDCNLASNCTESTDEFVIDAIKGERCWVDGRRTCILNIFSEQMNIGDCFAQQACVCAKDCSDYCYTQKFMPSKQCMSERCGCDLPKETVDKLQEDYFSKDLGVANPHESEELDAAIVDARLAREARIAEATAKREKYLHKLEKIQRKWNDYNAKADAAGISLDVFCNLTCSNSCFTDAEHSAEQVSHILTTCLIQKCHCFKPSLPKAIKEGEKQYDSLLEFTNIITQVESEPEQTYPSIEVQAVEKKTAEKVVDAIWGTDPVVEETKPVEPAVVEPVAPTTPEESKPVAPVVADTPAAPVEEHIAPVAADTPATPEPETPVAEPTSEHKDTTESHTVADISKEITDAVNDSVKDANATVKAAVKEAEVDITPAVEALVCDLGCFKECLALKKFAPYPVIETCVTKKCHCTVSIPNQEALELIDVDSLPEFTQSGGVGFFGFLWRFAMALIIGAALYFGTKKVIDVVDDKMKNSAWNEIDENEITTSLNQDYERIF